jgi:ribosomal protein S18 acetylase RimI-like enzyme
MDAIRLRRATQSDAPALGALHVASWRETYAGILPSEMLASLTVEARTTLWDQILDNPRTFGRTDVYVAEDEGRIIGFGSCSQQRDQVLTNAGFDGEIRAIYVLRSHQRLGIGRSIMRTMAQVLLRHDRVAATLWVLRENIPARAFYARLGGTVVGEKKEERPGAALVELAYAWRKLCLLAC